MIRVSTCRPRLEWPPPGAHVSVWRVLPLVNVVPDWTGHPIMGGAVVAEQRRSAVSRALDRVAEWLLPDPTAQVERALREFRERPDQQEQGSEEKPR